MLLKYVAVKFSYNSGIIRKINGVLDLDEYL